MWKRSSERLYGGKDGPNRLPSASLIKRNKASDVSCSGPELLQERRLTEAECSSALSSDMTDQFLTFQTLCSPKKNYSISTEQQKLQSCGNRLCSQGPGIYVFIKAKLRVQAFFFGAVNDL